MTKYSAIYSIFALAATLLGGVVASCNSSYDENEYTYAYSSTAITAFSLSANEKILNNLDSIYFSIDLNTGEIYNAQPLPYGTDISRMIVNIESDMCSATDIMFKTKAGADTTVNYLTNATDSINFAGGPVRIHVASYDGTAGQNYTVTINVYDHPVDSIYWTDVAGGRLPSAISGLQKQKTVESKGTYYMLTANATGHSIAVTTDPYDWSSWQSRSIRFDAFDPDIDSFTATSDGKLYVIDEGGNLYVSQDEAESWTVCDGVEMEYLYGAYEDKVIGCSVSGNTVYTSVYPGTSAPKAMPADFPVSGTSNMVCMTVRWGARPQGYIVGGRKLDGRLSGDTWGFDGNEWARISAGELDEAEGRSLFPYTFSVTDTVTWRTTEHEVLVTLGGKMKDNKLVDDVRFTDDMGMHWFDVDQQKQLPAEIKPRYGASVFVVEHEIKSRAIRPITEWNAPYIYLVGGYDITGRLIPDAWRGVLGYLTLKPLQ